jgi:hypothetical protein
MHTHTHVCTYMYIHIEVLIVWDGMWQWDCESIVSTYSNIYNHPKQIADSRKAIKILINKSTGLPQLEGSEHTDKDGQAPHGKTSSSLPKGLCTQVCVCMHVCVCVCL